VNQSDGRRYRQVLRRGIPSLEILRYAFDIHHPIVATIQPTRRKSTRIDQNKSLTRSKKCQSEKAQK
jgi:hypothetical protein